LSTVAANRRRASSAVSVRAWYGAVRGVGEPRRQRCAPPTRRGSPAGVPGVASSVPSRRSSRTDRRRRWPRSSAPCRSASGLASTMFPIQRSMLRTYSLASECRRGHSEARRCQPGGGDRRARDGDRAEPVELRAGLGGDRPGDGAPGSAACDRVRHDGDAAPSSVRGSTDSSASTMAAMKW
jgi:hypothetical protein